MVCEEKVNWYSIAFVIFTLFPFNLLLLVVVVVVVAVAAAVES
jgi:hypothetical protein